MTFVTKNLYYSGKILLGTKSLLKILTGLKINWQSNFPLIKNSYIYTNIYFRTYYGPAGVVTESVFNIKNLQFKSTVREWGGKGTEGGSHKLKCRNKDTYAGYPGALRRGGGEHLTQPEPWSLVLRMYIWSFELNGNSVQISGDASSSSLILNNDFPVSSFAWPPAF